MKNFAILTLLLLFTACNKPHPKEAQKPKKAEFIPPFVDYYLKSKDTVRYAFFKYDAKPDKYISQPADLSKRELAEIEKLINKRIVRYNKDNAGRDTIKEPSKYYKQFSTIINPKGEKEVTVHCSCEVFRGEWKKYLGRVDDGGSCFFFLKINLTKAKILKFMVNGLA